ncbi:NADP-dependent malic enzyme [Suttonella ornithocola]|uniref:NADP-dependent malic enzyme n=1 Tax=Suttonella ornithocola TaxID=279832 RepID=A0A380MM92_9GAMM|nr:NADP-dependent malic enzyme [Suttonella ornithocola]SUO93730.1 NADP-dependent malic enzyme [Suttonella ornithocola]
MTDSLKEEALRFHRYPVPGKIAVTPTKTLANQRDLSLAYSPGVAFACEAIVEDPIQADYLTAKANLVAVISNGTAVLGLGNIGALAGKPVMEGKGVLFKKFAGIDVFDIEVNETEVDKFIETVASLEPTFGGINLEDIKAPECFEIERRLKERMNIPVFHDDQHGTAIIASAALINALRLQGKAIEDVKVVASGAGAAGMACLDMFVVLGVKRENIIVCDSKGPIYKGRDAHFDERKALYAHDIEARTLAEAMVGADVFLGVSKAGLVTKEMIQSMADKPLVLALANPVPEIMPDEVHAVRSDAIVATGRSDFPNQVNNVLCFPYLFRGALDVSATTINDEMKMAAVYALADLAQSPADEAVIAAYGGKRLVYGPEYVIPKPFDPRLISRIPVAVAKAAMDTGVARRPIEDLAAYGEQLAGLINRSGFVMKPIIDRAKANPLKVAFAEGEDIRVLRAVLAAVQEGICQPIVIGRRETILQKIEKNNLPLVADKDFELIEPMNNPYYEECVAKYHELRGRDGVDPQEARIHLNTRPTVLAAILVKLGYADTMICGTLGRFDRHLRRVQAVLGTQEGMSEPAAVSMITSQKGTLFIADTHVHREPKADAICQITLASAEMIQRLGITPKAALISRSSFGECKDMSSSQEMRKALESIRKLKPDLEIDGEMQSDAALAEEVRNAVYPENKLSGSANLLIMPNLDAANISYNLMKVLTDGNVVGPILVGLAQPAQILTKVATSRRIFNMTAVAVVEAQAVLKQ